jgi:NADH-quinone oxidoreductase subunit M
LIGILIAIILLQIFWSFLIVILPRNYSSSISKIAAIISLLLVAYTGYLYTTGSSIISSSYTYSQILGITIGFTVTDVTLILLVMTAVVFFAASLAGDYFIGKNNKLYNFLFTLMEASAIGVFLSSSFLFLYVFWEITEVLIFFIILIFGGMNRKHAATKFIIYSIISSLLLLIGLIALYNYSTPHTFIISQLIQQGISAPIYIQGVIFAFLLVAFMIKIPVFPFHTWLPDAHTEAPATGSMVLAGVLLKFGGYGFILLFSIMSPLARTLSIYLAILFGFSSIYGAINALRNNNIKRMIAYTSIADMGIIAFALIAMNSIGTIGATYAMLSHGLAISCLFVLAGMFEKEFGTLQIDRISGLVKWSGTAAYLFILGVFAIIGLPLTSGFIGDILMFIGATSQFGIFGLFPIISIILIGAYFFWVIERSILGGMQVQDSLTGKFDKSIRNTLFVLIIATIILGIMPFLLISSNL